MEVLVDILTILTSACWLFKGFPKFFPTLNLTLGVYDMRFASKTPASFWFLEIFKFLSGSHDLLL